MLINDYLKLFLIKRPFPESMDNIIQDLKGHDHFY